MAPRRPASDIPRTNVEALEHADLIAMISGANGAQVHELGQMWNELGTELMNFGATLQGTAVSSESIWRGKAATAARARLEELVTWCQGTGEAMQSMGSMVLPIQAEAAQTAQQAMPPVVPYDPAAYQNRMNSTTDPREWARIQGDAHEQAARHEAARAEAVRVTKTYIAALLSTMGAMPAFTPPPEFGTGPTEPAPGAPTPGGHGATTDSGGSAPGSPVAAHPAVAHPAAGASHQSPHTPPATAAPGGSHPDGTDHSPSDVSAGATPVQAMSVADDLPGRTAPVGDGATGMPSLPTGIGAGDRERHPSVVGGRGSTGFGPRGSGAGNPPGARNALGRAGLSWPGLPTAGEDVTNLTSRSPGGGPGAGGVFGPMVGGGPSRGQQNTEHQRPSYLIETEDVWGDGRPVAPPVIGEDPPEPAP